MMVYVLLCGEDYQSDWIQGLFYDKNEAIKAASASGECDSSGRVNFSWDSADVYEWDGTSQDSYKIVASYTRGRGVTIYDPPI